MFMASAPSSPQAPRTARAVGRGTCSNAAGRFERHAREAVHDGWDIAEELPPLRTELTEERAGRIITRNASPDLSFDRSVNPYRGCEHGCVYCFARPSHAYLGLSPGLDFETKLTVKPGAAEVLRRELSVKGYAPAPIAIGTNTDPYQPVERERRVMRACLEVLSEFRHPVAIVTKGTLVARDLDILGEVGRAGLARVGVSITTLDAGLARSMEPRVPSPAHRLRAVERLARAGVPVRVCLAPVIPGLTDHEVESILSAAASAGATSASLALLRLPREVSALFREWLAQARPDRAARVMARVRETHGGQDTDSAFGRRLTGQGEVAGLIRRRFRLACGRLGLADRVPPLRTDLFRVPPGAGDQLSLF
ncbi:radical SAM protein [Rhodovulum sp. 12E13]|nr:PA0069 family radical SAM protein [Rhodovulum sp. 12E13]RDC73406.1 radical SAM protein [Rhodovulum sp. 12E13]